MRDSSPDDAVQIMHIMQPLSSWRETRRALPLGDFSNRLLESPSTVVTPIGRRFLTSAAATRNARLAFGVAGGATVITFGLSSVTVAAKEAKADWAQMRKDIANIMDEEKYDDGSIGPVLVRLAWHASGKVCPMRHTDAGGVAASSIR